MMNMATKALEASAVVFLLFASFAALSAFGKAPAPAQYHAPAEIYPQGSGSGLDADKLDSKDSSAFLTSEADTLQAVTSRGSTTTTGIKVGGSIDASGNRIVNVAAPSAAADAATKGYVDAASGGGGGMVAAGTYFDVGGNPYYCASKTVSAGGFVSSSSINNGNQCSTGSYKCCNSACVPPGPTGGPDGFDNDCNGVVDDRVVNRKTCNFGNTYTRFFSLEHACEGYCSGRGETYDITSCDVRFTAGGGINANQDVDWGACIVSNPAPSTGWEVCSTAGGANVKCDCKDGYN
jgi:hypothetical protein